MKSPLLSHIRPVGTLILTTDASAVGLGAELAQETHEGTHPVALLSELWLKRNAITRHTTANCSLLYSLFGTFATTFSAGGLCYVLTTNHCNIFPSPETLGVDAPEGVPNYSCVISASSRLKNCVADALSCLGLQKNPWTQLPTSLQVNHRNFWKTTCGLPKQPTLTSR